MKLSSLLYLLFIPMLMTPGLNASKDSNTETNVQSVYVEEDLFPDRRCERNLRESEAANRYLEKQMYILEAELDRSHHQIEHMEKKIREYEYQMNLYQKKGPRRPSAHGYEQGKGNKYGHNKYKKGKGSRKRY